MDYYNNLTQRMLFLIVITFFYPFYYPILGDFTLQGSVFLLKLFGFNPVVNDLSFILNGVQFNIIEACVAVFAYFLLAILILTSKDMDFKKGCAIFLVGAILVYLANIARIAILSWAYFAHGTEIFEKYHFIVWNFVSGVYVAFTWIFLTAIFRLKEVPIYSDIKNLYDQSLFKRK